ncbi:1-acyl-sn-glycerol-3-phosphate acyltransferase [Mycobacterium sp. MYCO198283]|uniref:lysophospholipid acyltransferase family protein n=1 Tax=Mycobacterium sp. MYCO198283 TaxID=2883505 RepID=UPI001E2B626C|nr:lysophospholipid acyltransferase family protein [Mycobacterium sp. MYCO198283]MCG5432985.1 1-acyl-sn-glycerol-3-phosphate acyltransferase [Mycobacterium sp. MYCO198283]
MAEPVYRSLELICRALVTIDGLRITYSGLENVPDTGGAVVAINHTSYLDWLPAALAASRRGRRIRFLIKAEMQRLRVVDYLIRHTGTIPVDRTAGARSYALAVEALRAGELVGVYPEATISRSFELKEFKSGAARMALEAQVPIIPLVVWGTQRVWTKDRPRKLLRPNVPVTVLVGSPLQPAGTFAQTDSALREAMTELLQVVQYDYPKPAGAWWVPARLGGGAPTLQEARELDEAERAARARPQPKRN